MDDDRYGYDEGPEQDEFLAARAESVHEVLRDAGHLVVARGKQGWCYTCGKSVNVTREGRCGVQAKREYQRAYRG